MSDNTVRSKYNKDASSYEKVMKWANYAQSMQQFLSDLDLKLPDRAKILDLGCGTGITTSVLRDKYPEVEIWGMDFSESMLKICHQKIPSAKLVQGSFNEPSGFKTFLEDKSFHFQPQSFDLVISTGALSEYGKLEKALPFVKSLLKESGILFDIGIKKGLIQWIQSKLWHFTPRGEKAFKEACKKAGFEKVDSVKIPARYFPTSLIKFAVKASKT